MSALDEQSGVSRLIMSGTTARSVVGFCCLVMMGISFFMTAGGAAHAAGTLKPKGAPQQSIRIQNHHADIVLNNGFAKVEITQTFYNPNKNDLEAIYAFPVPKSASLSEVTIDNGEKTLEGEVVKADKADSIYKHEKKQGNEAGLAKKRSYHTYRFKVYPVRSESKVRLRFVYYQPLKLDHNVGKFLYPLESGGTDERAKRFWTSNEQVEGEFSADIELKSSWPVADVRLPGYERNTTVDTKTDGHYKVHVEKKGAKLNRDLVFYYQLEKDLPGRVEMVAYKEDKSKPGTFMMVITPGVDLQPIKGGSDHMFVLDVSGSMSGKIGTLGRGVVKSLNNLNSDDRFRIVAFRDSAWELTSGWVEATPSNVKHWVSEVESLQSSGSTNLFSGMSLATNGLNDDRATSVYLATDAVANKGIVDPKAFHELMKKYDVRVFGFLMGNSGNWPLMEAITETSGGFYKQVSNADDIIGQLMMAKSKLKHEALHHVSYDITGVKTFDSTKPAIGKVYRGDQIVIFGRYAEGGDATVTLNARMTGEDKQYTTDFTFPDVDTGNPELERLWAMNRVEAIHARRARGKMEEGEARGAIQSLGLDNQIVTDYTSMLVLSDKAFKRHGIKRRNKKRIEREHKAQAQRSNQPAQNRRVDKKDPAFSGSAPSIGGGGAGAVGPLSGLLSIGLTLLAGWFGWKQNRQ